MEVAEHGEKKKDLYSAQADTCAADGIPADLVVVEMHTMTDLPQMSFFSPADDHESTVVFSPDLFPDDERVGEFYAMVDGMLEKKRQHTEKIWELLGKENGNCAGSRKG